MVYSQLSTFKVTLNSWHIQAAHYVALVTNSALDGKGGKTLCSIMLPEKYPKHVNSLAIVNSAKQNSSCYCFKLSSVKAREYECEMKDINHKTNF